MATTSPNFPIFIPLEKVRKSTGCWYRKNDLSFYIIMLFSANFSGESEGEGCSLSVHFPAFFTRCSPRRCPILRAFPHSLNAWNRLPTIWPPGAGYPLSECLEQASLTADTVAIELHIIWDRYLYSSLQPSVWSNSSLLWFLRCTNLLWLAWFCVRKRCEFF